MTGYILGLLYLAGFGGLTLWAARRAGRSLWLFDRAQARAAMGFRVAFLLLAIWPVAGWLPLAPLPGLLLALAGAALALLAQGWMGRSWRIGAAAGQQGALVTDGPFALSRNPVFVGQVMLFAGLALYGALVLWAALALVLWSVRAQVRREEAVLSTDPAWQAYAARTRRWLGRRSTTPARP